ncbi:MAG: AAA family ATPase [Deltaproteobacteria bacterium]|nr:AAA family ATPase [Deltaproteobacteria bacterium]
MKCAKCGADNREGRKFCAKCAAPLARLCPRCGAQNQPDEDFCGECAASLESSPGGGPAKKPNEPRIRIVEGSSAENFDGERKTVTALFADIKGSMELMEGLDPEEARAIVDPALKLMIEAVHHYGGFVVQSTGDGIFALFGAPLAHEDHPQRALYAALRIQGEMRRYGDRMRTQGQTPLQVRIGVNTGEVVVRSIQTGADHIEYTPIGHSTGLAARLQTLATPGTTMISGSTRRLVEGFFQLKSFGPARLKGVTEQVDVYEVTGLGPLRTRLQRAAVRGLTKFVGRQREMEALTHAAEQARSARGQIVAVMAEPGVGKSRLFYEFKATSQSAWMVLEAPSVSYGKASAYLPVIELLSQYFEISRDDDDRKRRERILGKVLGLDRTLEDTLPYLYSLQGVADGGDSLVQMDPQIRTRRTLEAIKRILLRESINQPLMVIFEDLHWIDSETQALLNLLADAIANARILLLVNYRPEYRHEWGSRTHYTQLRLDPLGPESAEEMLATLLGEAKDLSPLKRLIIERTQGTPFFIEEMVQCLFDEGALRRNGKVTLASPISAIKVPPTVQAVLASRIDRLPVAEKEFLQTLAVMGRDFSLNLVGRVTAKTQDESEHMLAQLQLGEFIYEQPTVGEVEYTFKHALTHEVAYNSLLTERRRALHERVGHTIEELYTDQLEDRYNDLAYHYLRSNDVAKAIHYAQLAAGKATGQGKYAAATGIIESALKFLDQLPRGERLHAELGLRNIEASVALVLSGGASHEYERAVRRICEISEELGSGEHLLRGQIALGYILFNQAEPARGLELARHCVELAEARRDPGLLVDVRLVAGLSAMFCGNFREAILHLELGREISLPRGREVQGGRVAGVGFSFNVSVIFQLLGCLGEAARMADEALRRARESNHVFTLSYALVMRALLCRYRREPDAARMWSEQGIALAEENGFPWWLEFGRLVHAWALTELGQLETGMAELASAIVASELHGINLRQTERAHLAYCYAKTHRIREALSLLNDVLAQVEHTGEKMHQAEIIRAKGEVLLMQDCTKTAEAEACFRAALDVARAQEAKWWELRASVSLGRLLRDTNRGNEGRAIVGEIYNWFTEGFELPDLKEAMKLLEQLNG